MVNIISEKMKPHVIVLSMIVLFFIGMNNLVHKDRSMEIETTPVESLINTGNEGHQVRKHIEFPSACTSLNKNSEGAMNFSGYPSCKRLIGITIM